MVCCLQCIALKFEPQRAACTDKETEIETLSEQISENDADREEKEAKIAKLEQDLSTLRAHTKGENEGLLGEVQRLQDELESLKKEHQETNELHGQSDASKDDEIEKLKQRLKGLLIIFVLNSFSFYFRENAENNELMMHLQEMYNDEEERNNLMMNQKMNNKQIS